MSEVRHNSGVAVQELRSNVNRVERLEDEIADWRLSIKDVYAEAKARGYDVKALRKVIAMRRKDRAKLAEEQAMIDLYAGALGVFE